MSPLETYLREMAEIRGPGVPETSFYPPLHNLLNAVGDTLKPKVRCIINLKNKGAGIPDGGLFTADLLKKNANVEPLEGLPPDRGAIEVKPVSDDAWLVADSEQVSKYWGKYGHVLVTNYRDFVIVGRDARGKPVKLETYRLADSAAAFWSGTATPRKTADLHSERFLEYLKRVMLHAAPISAPEDIAWFLASYASDARIRIEQQPDLPALAAVRTALEEALGLKFQGAKGEHFFRSTLVQTLFYGIFSAWVLWHREDPIRKDRFDWSTASRYLRVPVLRKLFYQVADPSQLDELKLSEVLDWAVTVLNRVDRNSFFAAFTTGHEIQYFYEPFLKAFDPALRKQLGVWYTPTEIVQYQVGRVDTVLREELGIPDGLADKRVYVLDPCCGTGAYLVEVLRHIAATLKDKQGDALCAAEVKKAATERVFGFEILPAPFVVAHLQLGLLLQNLGVPLTDKKRIGVYLTNSLTGWQAAGKQTLKDWPELEGERAGADSVKREKPILVVLGNPPYNAFAGVSSDEEEGLVETYKGVYFVDRKTQSKRKGIPGATQKTRRYKLSDPEAQGGWGVKKFNLDDLYARFFRLAERRIAEKTGQGIVCYITNFSYISDPSFVIMRQRFLSEFDKVWVDCLNGDSRETGKLTPEGKPDPSVFSTESNHEGIRVGTAIALMVRKAVRNPAPEIHYRQFWGATKRQDLLQSIESPDVQPRYQPTTPERSNRYSFAPSTVPSNYIAWPKLTELCAMSPINGLMEKRGGALIDIDRPPLEERMRKYCNPEVDWETLVSLKMGLTDNADSLRCQESSHQSSRQREVYS